MSYFSGHHFFTVDAKGRIIMPSQFREVMKNGKGSKLFVTKAPFEKCLFIYPQQEWDTLLEKVAKKPSSDKAFKFFKRKVIGSARETDMDKQGRMQIHAPLREEAGISLNGEIVIVGQLQKIELWNKGDWDLTMKPDAGELTSYEEQLTELDY